MSNATEPFYDYSVILEKTWSVSLLTASRSNLWMSSVVFVHLSTFAWNFQSCSHFCCVQGKRFGNDGECICFLCKYHREYFCQGLCLKTNGRPVYKLHPVNSVFCVFSLMFQLIRSLGYEAMFLLHWDWNHLFWIIENGGSASAASRMCITFRKHVFHLSIILYFTMVFLVYMCLS